jgi:hypothetical protein
MPTLVKEDGGATIGRAPVIAVAECSRLRQVAPRGSRDRYEFRLPANQKLWLVRERLKKWLRGKMLCNAADEVAGMLDLLSFERRTVFLEAPQTGIA